VRIFKKGIHLQEHLQKITATNANSSVGFVPTMGALHKGHISLIAQSKAQHRYTCCSIFVNPTQFNDPADFEKYPNTIEQDMLMLEEAGCDFLLLPTVAEMYPNGTHNLEQYDLGFLETLLEGAFRPGHYQGVCQVVYRLLKMVMPNVLYLGQKDYQQCMVINSMINLTDLKGQVAVSICETLREPDGLAMSSRNMRLSKEERSMAVEISKQLAYIKTNGNTISLSTLEQDAVKNLTDKGFKVDYVSIHNSTTLARHTNVYVKDTYVVLAAAFCGSVRLIDNMLI
jgi:pantoate--beta-alanine ligase